MSILASMFVAVQGLDGRAGKLKDGLTYRLAGDCAGMDRHASDHGGPIDNGNSLARLRRRNGPPLACGATADHHKVVFGFIHLDARDSPCNCHRFFKFAQV